MYFFVVVVFETHLKDFPFYSPIILTLWFRYLQTRTKKSCMYLSSQLFFKTSHETLNPKKNPRKMHFPVISIPKFKKFYLGVYLGPTPRSHWTKQRVKKLNLWGNKAVDKSAWIKACMTLLFLKIVSATFLIVCF